MNAKSLLDWWRELRNQPQQEQLGKAEDEHEQRLTDLLGLVIGVASLAHLYAYSTSPGLRQWLTSPECPKWSEFRERAEELSRPYPKLRPMLGRLYLALEDLAARGRDGCLPPETNGNVLFSDANPCHAPGCEVQKLADRLQEAILRQCVGG